MRSKAKTPIDRSKGRIWGYARSSKDEQTESPKCQAERIAAKGVQLKHDSKGHPADVFLENESADKVSWRDRPEFSRLMNLIKPGDTLIVWRLDRLDRNPFRLIEIVKKLVDNEIALVVLDYGGMEIDLSTAFGRSFVFMMASHTDMFMQNMKESIREALAWRRRNGMPYCKVVPWGKRKRSKPDPQHHGRRIKWFEWDLAECQQIAEIVVRRRAGESSRSIAKDFMLRQERRANGDPWSRLYGKTQQVYLKAILAAYDWAEEEIKKTGTIGGVRVDSIAIPEVPTAELQRNRPYYGSYTKAMHTNYKPPKANGDGNNN